MLCIYEKIIYGFEARFMQIIEGIRNLFISNRIKLNQVQLYYLIKWILVLKITLKGKLMYITNPSEIEKKSFEIIDKIIKSEYKGYEFKSSFEEKIIKRCVHTSADFDYLYNLKISENFEDIIKKAIEEKATIYTDTTMALSGINKTSLKKYGMEVRCLIADEETKLLAEKMKITRSMASVIRLFEDKNPKIAVVGNAPTFLYKTLEMYEQKKSNLRAIIGAPVGFVEAKESKDKLFETDIPQIVALGRKGGSNIAAAIVNAILYALV